MRETKERSETCPDRFPGRRCGHPGPHGLALASALLLGIILGGVAFAQRPQDKGTPGLLREVRDEVKAMGAQAGEPFIQWNFFIGDDDDDTNKWIYALVMIEPSGEYEKMRLQLTWMEAEPRNPRVKKAGDNRLLGCLFKDDAFHLISSEFAESELEALLPGLLKAVREKKRLLDRD